MHKHLTNEELIALAKRECEEQKWLWLEPVAVQDGLGAWTVVTNYGAKGCNARIQVSKKTGQIVQKSFMAR